jgi:hypothetical protein
MSAFDPKRTSVTEINALKKRVKWVVTLAIASLTRPPLFMQTFVQWRQLPIGIAPMSIALARTRRRQQGKKRP